MLQERLLLQENLSIQQYVYRNPTALFNEQIKNDIEKENKNEKYTHNKYTRIRCVSTSYAFVNTSHLCIVFIYLLFLSATFITKYRKNERDREF